VNRIVPERLIFHVILSNQHSFVFLLNAQFSALTIQCASFIPDPPTSLTAGVPSAEFSLAPFETKSFTLAITLDERITCVPTALASVEIDLYLRLGAAPAVDGGNYDCVSDFEGSEEFCFVRNIGGADVLWATVVSVEDVVSSGLCPGVFSPLQLPFRTCQYRCVSF